MNNILMMNNSKPALFSTVLTSSESGGSFGYIKDQFGNLSNKVFESIEITTLWWFSVVGYHILVFNPVKPNPDITKIKIDGVEYLLNFNSDTSYNFNTGSSLFANESIHQVEFIR